LMSTFNSEHINAARNVAGLLRLRSILRVEEGDADAALTDCRAMLNVARPLVEEPSPIYFLAAVAIRHMASFQVQRVMAQGQPSRSALTALQSRLDEEAAHPSLLTALRGERAEFEDTVRSLAGGRLELAKVEEALQMFDKPKEVTGYQAIDAW